MFYRGHSFLCVLTFPRTGNRTRCYPMEKGCVCSVLIYWRKVRDTAETPKGPPRPGFAGKARSHERRSPELLAWGSNPSLSVFLLAEGEGFEPPDPCRSSVFKTDAIDHSANLPCNCLTAYDILSKNRAFVNRLVLPRHGVGVFLDKTVRFGYTLQNQMPAGRGHKRRVQ